MFKLHLFLFLKLPNAFFSGVRVKSLQENSCITSVKHRWINQNPFGSIYFAVLAMASELSTGALVLQKIKTSNKKVSMLVTHQKSTFLKKAKGQINFTCTDGKLIDEALNKSIETGEGISFWMKSTGIDEENEVVTEMKFEWSLKVKNIS
ncbi:MAG: DUF4442 domain-containing protein [Vicingaceae bacterium]|nr:DUF4442 domain-containing protein [Vicingaceae bacterium]